MSEKEREILLKYQPYYKALSDENKKEFENRVKWWISQKRFIPRQMDTVSLEMKVLVASAAVQLTFGLPIYFFQHFRKIVLYPDSYYSEINQRYHRGEVNPQFGLIILSWKAFVEGYMQHNSGRNLGLHEMAHAIKLESLVAGKHRSAIDIDAWQLWLHESSLFIQNEEKNGFFRDYAYTDEHEFFAVAIENFFERTLEFKRLKPKLYNSLVNLLKQDPIKLLNMY